MTKLLKKYLSTNYLAVLKAKMLEKHHNFTSLARETQYSKTHIGNIFKGRGSDDAIAAVCKVLGIQVIDLFKEEYRRASANEDSETLGRVCGCRSRET